MKEIAIAHDCSTNEGQQPDSSNSVAGFAGATETRQCTKCKDTKPIDDFISKAATNTASPYYSRLCKPCIQQAREQEKENERNREADRQMRRRQREAQSEQIKKHLDQIDKERRAKIENMLRAEEVRRAKDKIEELRENPPPQHPRHPSGFPCNPFTGIHNASNRRATIERTAQTDDETELAV
ncbi:hypothetical protein ACFQ3P_13740 [Paraburkholderia sabiae]|uniref:Stc1 domain-containing protein n=1 Tax=Paraburkholderia sabiae TaxID=273251 RepID=A0ABU9QD54_9BURK|nr:hypothetical protein [Paraburkholderia sabiae]WJZ76161.1 hypothetical protein QEN71_10280 [Paraburkholderia sabiae]